jgi:hypothetical protein
VISNQNRSHDQLEEALAKFLSSISATLGQSVEKMQEMKEEDGGEDFHNNDLKLSEKRRTTKTSGASSNRSEREFEGDVDDSDDWHESHDRRWRSRSY